MAATDHLGTQFGGKADRSKSDRRSERRAAELDAKGADEQEDFGFDAYGYGDSQWNRAKHSDQREVF